MFPKTCTTESADSFEIEEGCKLAYVKLIPWSIVVKEDANTLIFLYF